MNVKKMNCTNCNSSFDVAKKTAVHELLQHHVVVSTVISNADFKVKHLNVDSLINCCFRRQLTGFIRLMWFG